MATKAEIIGKISELQAQLAECEKELAEIEEKPFSILACTARIECGMPVARNVIVRSSTFQPNMADMEAAGIISPEISITCLVPLAITE